MATENRSSGPRFGLAKKWAEVVTSFPGGPSGTQCMLSNGMIRLAFMGRTSTDDQQDPTISIPRQFRACSVGLPATVAVVASFYDVECGRNDLSQRGRGRSHEQFEIPVPRDGGIQDLLEEARRSERRFDA